MAGYQDFSKSNKDARQRTFTFGEMDHLASVVGDLAIDQFSNQQEYREAIYCVFSCYVFQDECDMKANPEPKKRA